MIFIGHSFPFMIYYGGPTAPAPRVISFKPSHSENEARMTSQISLLLRDEC